MPGFGPEKLGFSRKNTDFARIFLQLRSFFQTESHPLLSIRSDKSEKIVIHLTMKSLIHSSESVRIQFTLFISFNGSFININVAALSIQNEHLNALMEIRI